MMRPNVVVLYTYTVEILSSGTRAIVKLSCRSDDRENSGDVRLLPVLGSTAQLSNSVPTKHAK